MTMAIGVSNNTGGITRITALAHSLTQCCDVRVPTSNLSRSLAFHVNVLRMGETTGANNAINTMLPSSFDNLQPHAFSLTLNSATVPSPWDSAPSGYSSAIVFGTGTNRR